MGLSFYTGATGFLGRNLLGALMRETGDEYLVLIWSSSAACLRGKCCGESPLESDLLMSKESTWQKTG